jgi:hypothetical protein
MHDDLLAVVRHAAEVAVARAAVSSLAHRAGMARRMRLPKR